MSCAATSAVAFELWLTAGFNRLAAAHSKFAADRTASTAIEYAMILSGIAFSTLGVTSAIGVEIIEIFDTIKGSFNYGSCIVCVPD